MSVKKISFKTSDGVTLVGRHFIAQKPTCLLVFFLGMGGSASSRSVMTFFEYASQKGISSIVITTRGHAESQGLFTIDNYAKDIKEITKKYAPLASLEKIPYYVGAHSLGTIALLRTQVTADHVLLFNPIIHTKFLHAPMKFISKYSRKITIALWNFSIGKRKIITDSINWCRITDENFKDLREDMLDVTRNRSTIKNDCDCTLILTTGDTYQKYNDPTNQHRVQEEIAPLFNHLDTKVLSNLSHFISDGNQSFMRTKRVDEVIDLIKNIY